MAASLEKGLSSQEEIKKKKLRGETKQGQRPTIKKESVSSDRGKFAFK